MGTNFDAIKLAVEGATGGKNTVLFDDLGNPSIMVEFLNLRFVMLLQVVQTQFILHSLLMV